MKTLKQNNQFNRIRTIFISLLIIITVGIVIAFVLENKSNAEEAEVTCPENPEHQIYPIFQNDDEYHWYYCTMCFVNYKFEHVFSEETSSGNEDDDTHDLKKTCTICGHVVTTKAECVYGDTAEYRDETYHARFCIDENCQAEKLFEHEDNNNDFICDWAGCEYVMHTHSYKETYEKNNDGTHTIIKICEGCGDRQTGDTVNCTYGLATSDGESTHSKECEKCKYIFTQNHYGESHDNGGICQETGCGEKTQNHESTGEISEYKKNEEEHIPLYTCSYPGCKGTHEGIPEKHKDGNHENGGICQVEGCGYQYQEHKNSNIIKGCKAETDGHTLTYKCSFEGCEGTYDGTKEGHYGGNHENGGTCQLEECGYKYQTHEQSDIVKEYKKTKDGHIPIYYCTYSGCIETFEGEIQEHSGATHQNGGVCTVEGCGYKYENHGQATAIKEYKKTQSGHTPIYYCTQSGCTESYEGEEQAHSGGNHENEGKCEVIGCEYQYETHGKSETIKEYIKTASGHTPIYKCTDSKCSKTYEGEEEKHSGGTHQNGGVCTVEGCGYQYENHGQSLEIKEYKKSEEGHTPTYYCTQSGCTESYEGEEQAHSGATHENGGKCKVCTYQYETHRQSDEIKQYTKTDEGHIPIYKCSKEDCNATYNGEKENHDFDEWTDNGDATHSSTCTICNYTIKENHVYMDEECKYCGAQKPKEECEHSYVDEYNEVYHWKKCSECSEIQEGSKKTHIHKIYKDNGDGTHNSNCIVCEYELINEEHNYVNDKCIECGAEEPKQECKHSYEFKNNKTYHWKECLECGEEKQESKEKHTYKNYKDNGDGTHTATCSECGYKLTEEHDEKESCDKCGKEKTPIPTPEHDKGKDESTSDKEIPLAGIKSTIVFVVLGIIAILGISIFKINKYNGV